MEGVDVMMAVLVVRVLVVVVVIVAVVTAVMAAVMSAVMRHGTGERKGRDAAGTMRENSVNSS